MELSREQKKEIVREVVPNFNINNWARYEDGAKAWAELNLRDAPFVDADDDILKPKDIFI